MVRNELQALKRKLQKRCFYRGIHDSVWKACRKRSLLDTCSTHIRTAQDVAFELAGYERLMSKICVASDVI